jgi:hypothetical protein
VNVLRERNFYRENRILLAALLGLAIFLATADTFTRTANYPVMPTRFNIDPEPNWNSRFWIITSETYTAKLWVGQPAELDRKTFDLITGCNDYSILPSQRVLTPKWTIRSVWDQRVVIQGDAILINPPANECSSTGGGHVFSLGEFAVAPGRYQFELKFSNIISDSMSFPVELNVHRSRTFSHTRLGHLAVLFDSFLMLIPFLVFAFLLLALFIRAGIFLYALHSK